MRPVVESEPHKAHGRMHVLEGVQADEGLLAARRRQLFEGALGRWSAQIGSLRYNERFDLEPSGFPASSVGGDGDVDITDLQFVFGRHGSDCLNPHPRQEPVNTSL